MSENKDNPLVITPQPEDESNDDYERCRKCIDEGLFHSEKDREIATHLLDLVSQRYRHQLIDRFTFKSALLALEKLVPIRNERGMRQIVDIPISPLMEATIRSRLESQQIDVTAADGSWGRLPDNVKKEIASKTHPWIEMTTNCTVRCSFCALADKGPIQQKMTFDSVLAIIRFLRENQATGGDILYAGSDPFDAKWRSADGELDYLDLVEKCWEMDQDKSRKIYTSTAIPLGEEWRILAFAKEYLQRKRKGTINPDNDFRLSMTNTNRGRIACMRTILDAIAEEATSDDYQTEAIYISDNREEDVSRSGNAWREKSMSISIWDILGPNCVDNIYIGVQSVDGVALTAGSNEMPSGEDRSPIESEKDGTTVYRIPHYYFAPTGKEYTSFDWGQIFPDIRYSQITIDANSTQNELVVVRDNPHRAFLRIVGHLQKIAQKYTHMSEVTAEEKSEFRERLRDEIRLVQDYLNMGANNVSMSTFMQFFKENGFLE